MVDSRYIQDLLAILKTHGVRSFKAHGLELEFHHEYGDPKPSPEMYPIGPTAQQEADSTQIIADTLRKQEEAMPVDLRADTLMDQDKILNWSSPDQSPDQPELPLTGETPL